MRCVLREFTSSTYSNVRLLANSCAALRIKKISHLRIENLKFKKNDGLRPLSVVRCIKDVE